MKNYKKLLLVTALMVHSAQADILELLGIKRSEASVDVVLGDEKKAEIAILKNEITAQEEKEKQFWIDHQAREDKIKSDIKGLEVQVRQPNQNTDFINKELLLLKSIKQAFSRIKSTWKELFSRIKQHITLLEGYVKDPEFVALQLEKKSFYSFEDLQNLNEQIAAQEEKLTTIQSEKSEAQLDLANRKKKITHTEIVYKEKVLEQTEFSSHSKDQPPIEGLTPRQHGQILDLQVALALYEKELAQLRVEEEEAEVIGIVSRVDIASKRMQVLRKKRDLMARMSLRVDEHDIAKAKNQLSERKKQYLNAIDQYGQEIDALVRQEELLKEKLRQLQTEQEGVIENSAMLTEWTTRPKTANAYFALGQTGIVQEQLHVIERGIDLLHAQTDLEQAEFSQEELSFDIVQSWYKIKHQKFKKSEEFSKELKRYGARVSTFERERAIFEDRRRTATGKLNLQNKALSDLKELQEKLVEQRQALFRGDSRYQICRGCFDKAVRLLTKQVEITSKLIEVHSKLLVSMNKSVRQSNTMIAELERASLWHRSGGAISREGIGNLLPDIRIFLSDIKTLGFSYVSGFSISSVSKTIMGTLQQPRLLLSLLFKLLLALLCFILLGRYLPVISRLFSSVSQEVRWVYIVAQFFSMTLEFLHGHLKSFFIWLALFIMLGLSPSPEIPSIFFFLFSIPYLLYLSHKFVRYFAQFNEERQYTFFSESFQERFIPFLSWLLYMTVIIFSFREAFILATYAKSELPDILLALYSIVVRVLLLSLIRKEDLLNIIPSKTAVGTWVWRIIDHYYYPVLLCFIVIMIMMDPHIGGYNKLVYYLVWGTIGTLFTLKIFFELYAFCRRSSSLLFFSSDGEVLKERFQFSKILYGLSIILLFFFFTAFAGLCVAWVWGKPVSFDILGRFFTTERLTITGSAGQLQKLSILDLLKSFSFVPLGFLVGWIVDRFIVHRIFSVLLVNPGVQNAVSTIAYYFVITSVITVGLWTEGFGFIIAIFIAPILLGVAWSLRDIFNDFVAYFVILIQRPLKVGDYIKLDPETCGVVRNISPRAVVLRRKKGFSVIIPNSRIVRETIVNWDYNLNFIACPDVIVKIPYRFSAEKARDIFRQSIEKCSNVLRTPPPVIRLDDFGEYSFTFMVRVFTSPENTLLQWEIASDVRFAIDKLIRENDMELAFPIRLIKLDKKAQEQLGGIAVNDPDKPE